MEISLGIWIGFNLSILLLIAIDLFCFRKADKESFSSVVWASVAWICVALLFNYAIYHYLGREAGLNFLAGYLIEKSLSIDNVFVFIMLFKYFKTPKRYQHKILFWGVLGAILMRAVMIVGGLALINTFSWIFYVFGFFLVISGIKMAFTGDSELHPDQNSLLRFVGFWIPISSDYDDGRFFTKKANRWSATPLFAILLCIESADLIFALDSIPAVIAITRDPFIIYTSNVFAILGLRSLFFVLAKVVSLFHLLHYALSLILIFIGLKMLISHFIAIPVTYSLTFIFLSISIAIIASNLFPQKK